MDVVTVTVVVMVIAMLGEVEECKDSCKEGEDDGDEDVRDGTAACVWRELLKLSCSSSIAVKQSPLYTRRSAIVGRAVVKLRRPFLW